MRRSHTDQISEIRNIKPAWDVDFSSLCNKVQICKKPEGICITEGLEVDLCIQAVSLHGRGIESRIAKSEGMGFDKEKGSFAS